jgi:hypothetical protein
MLRQLADVHIDSAGGLMYFVAESTKMPAEVVSCGKHTKDDLITLRGSDCVDLIELSEQRAERNLCSLMDKPLMVAGDFSDLCGLASPQSTCHSLKLDTPSRSRMSSILLPRDLDFSQSSAVSAAPMHERRRNSMPEVFNISQGDLSYESTSNPELNKMFSFAPHDQVPLIPSLGSGRDYIPIALNADPFASVVADAYVQCLKA